MACRIIWSPISRDDLHDIVRFIARDNPRRAESFALEIMTRADVLHEQPEIGRVVPEHHDAKIREIIFRSYRIVYRFDKERNTIGILRVWHGARGTPDL